MQVPSEHSEFPAAEFLKPPELAARWRCKPHFALDCIKRGELEAINLSRNPESGRLRWRIHIDSIRQFETRRSAAAKKETKRALRRRRRQRRAARINKA